MAVKRYSRAPQKIKDSVRALYVKALRLANSEPTETKEIQHMYNTISRWMNGDDTYEKSITRQAPIDEHVTATTLGEDPLWAKEFNASWNVPAAIYKNPLVVDTSWHNDACPSFKTKDGKRRLWVEHPIKSKRELDVVRFVVTDNGECSKTFFASETDLAGALQALLEV